MPSSFVEVIDTLVDLVIRYEGPNSESKPKDASTGAPSGAVPCLQDISSIHCTSLFYSLHKPNLVIARKLLLLIAGSLFYS